MGSKPVAFSVSNATSYPLLLELAIRCVERGETVSFIYEHGEDDLYRRIAADANALEAKAVSFEAEANGNASSLSRFSERLTRGLRKRIADPNPKYAIFLEIHERRMRAAKRVLQSVEPKLLFVAEDGITGNMWLLSAARATGLPIIDCPYGYGTRRDLENDLARKDEAGDLIMVAGQAGMKVAESYPQWVKSGRFAGAMMFQPEDILAREAVGISVQDAWVIHGGFSNRICVESQHMLEFYQSEGIPSGKLVLTGSPYSDIMYRSLEADALAQAAFMSPRKISNGQTRVLVCWPPSYHADRANRCEFASYEELSETVLGYLASLSDIDLRVSLHPAVTDTNRKMIAELGVPVAPEYIMELIPRCDVYVSCFSSTIRSAIAVGKPVVNYDFYGFELADYEAAPGVLSIDTFDSFKDVMTRLCEDVRFYADVAAQQLEVAKNWGVVDGRQFDRIYDVFQEMAGQ